MRAATAAIAARNSGKHRRRNYNLGRRSNFPMVDAAQSDMMASQPMLFDVNSPPAQQPRYQHAQPGEPIGFAQSINCWCAYATMGSSVSDATNGRLPAHAGSFGAACGRVLEAPEPFPTIVGLFGGA